MPRCREGAGDETSSFEAEQDRQGRQVYDPVGPDARRIGCKPVRRASGNLVGVSSSESWGNGYPARLSTGRLPVRVRLAPPVLIWVGSTIGCALSS